VSPKSGRLLKGKQTINPLTQGAELISRDGVPQKPHLSKAERPAPKDVQRKNDLDQLHPFERGIVRQTPTQSNSSRMQGFLCYQEADHYPRRSASVEPSSNHRPAGRASDLDFTERLPTRTMRRVSSTIDCHTSVIDSSCDTPRSTAFRMRDQNGAPMHVGGIGDLLGTQVATYLIMTDGVETEQFYAMDEFYTDAQYGDDFGYYSKGHVLHSKLSSGHFPNRGEVSKKLHQVRQKL